MTSIYNRLYPAPSPNRPSSIPHDIRFWMIEMSTGGGHYIVLPGSWSTKVRAELNFPPNLANICQAAEYQRGRGTDGPERVNP